MTSDRGDPSVRTHAFLKPTFCALLTLLGLAFLTDAVWATSAQENDPADSKQHFGAGVRQLRDSLRIPGLSIAVLKDGAVIYQQREGFANLEKQIPISEDNLFQIASVTKTFTANLVMQYEEAHLASVDDPVLKFRFVDIGFGWPLRWIPTHASDISFRTRRKTDQAGPSSTTASDLTTFMVSSRPWGTMPRTPKRIRRS